jgi:hypothetical protein
VKRAFECLLGSLTEKHKVHFFGRPIHRPMRPANIQTSRRAFIHCRTRDAVSTAEMAMLLSW